MATHVTPPGRLSVEAQPSVGLGTVGLGTPPALSSARSTESDGGVDEEKIATSGAFAHRPMSWLLRGAICHHTGRQRSRTNLHCSHLLLALRCSVTCHDQ